MKMTKTTETKEKYCERRVIELGPYKNMPTAEIFKIAEREWDRKHTKQVRTPSFKVFFIGDPHFGHANIIRYDGRPFNSVAEMDEELIRRWNEVVGDNDIVIIVGDLTWYDDEKTAEILKRLKGRKVLVKGNHDNLGPLSMAELYQFHHGYLELNDYETRKKLVISHYPIHFYNGQRRGTIMLYAHVHNAIDETVSREVEALIKERLNIDFTMINTGCMYWDYTPRTLAEMLSAEGS